MTGKLQCGAGRSRRARNHTSARDRDRLCAYLLHVCLLSHEAALHRCMAPPRVGGTSVSVGGLGGRGDNGQKKLLALYYEYQDCVTKQTALRSSWPLYTGVVSLLPSPPYAILPTANSSAVSGSFLAEGAPTWLSSGKEYGCGKAWQIEW